MAGVGKRLVVGRRNPVDVEQCKVLKQKLETFATKKKSRIEALDKVLLEKKLFDNFDENTKQEDMKELLKQARHLHLDCSQEAVDKASTNLRRTEGLVGAALGDCRATFTRVTEEGEVCKEWVVKVQPVEEVPELVITQEIHTRAAPGDDQLARIEGVKLEVEGIDMDEDFEEALRSCEEEREVQRFTHLVVSYLPLAEERERVVRRAASGGHCTRRGHTLEFSNSLSIPLFSVSLRIRMSLRQGSGWSLVWRAQLSEAGSQAASSMHLPRSLVRSGRVEEWGVEEALETLAKVARLDAQTPRKEVEGPGGLARVDSTTPRVGPEKLKAKQRKLYD